MAESKARLVYGSILLVFALLYSVAYFPGLEYHSGYYGFAYKILYPDSSSGDLSFVSGPPAYVAYLPEAVRSLMVGYTSHPAYFSLYTVLVKIAGELWLDDRFNLLVFWFLVVFSIWGLERISALCGLNRLERIAVVAIVLLEHTFKDNIPQVVSRANYSPTNFAYPLAIWLGYFVLKGGPASKTLCLALLCVLTSVKNTWFPAFVSLLFIARDSWNVKWSRIAGGVVVGLLALFAGYFVLHGANLENAFVFDEAHRGTENSEADPFMEPGVGNLLYMLLLAGTALVTVAPPRVTLRIRVLCLVSALVFLLGGVYYTFTPNELKIPFLMALAVNRSTWWSQLIVFVVLSSYAISLFDRDSVKAKILSGVILLFLYGIPWFGIYTWEFRPYHPKRVAVVALLQAGLFLLLYIGRRRKSLSHWWAGHALPAAALKAALLVPLTLVTAQHLARVAWARIPSLNFLMKYGIMGDNPGAKWVGVNEFFRYEAEKSSTVVALSEGDVPWRGVPAGVMIDSALKIRSGISTPVVNSIEVYFDRDKRLRLKELLAIEEGFPWHWAGCDAQSIRRDLHGLGSPEYLVIPARRSCVLDGMGYVVVREINGFLILRREVAVSLPK